MRELLQETLKEVAPLNNELDVFVPDCLLFRNARYEEPWPTLADGVPQCIELIVASSCLKALELVLSPYYIGNVLVADKARLHNFIVTVIAEIPVVWYLVLVRCVLNHLSELRARDGLLGISRLGRYLLGWGLRGNH